MGLSQEEFGKLVGLNRGNIASYEKQSAEPSIINLSRISKYFNIDLGDLIEEDLSERNKLISQIDEPDANAVEEALKESLEDHSSKIEKFRKRSDEMARILMGFRQFHKFRMENPEDLSEDVKKMAMDYERLLEVLEDVLSTNRHIMQLLDKRQ